MPTVAEVEELALHLSDNERALLATRLLDSLPPMLSDEDEGIAEAVRRDSDFDNDPNFGMSLEEFDERMKQRLR